MRRWTCRPAPAGALCPTPAAAYLRCSRDQQDIVLHAGSEPGLRRVAFELESRADLDAAMAHFTSAGYAPRSLSADERSALKQGDSFRVRERHSGLELEFFAATTVLAKACVPTVAKIVRLGHGVIGSADFARRRAWRQARLWHRPPSALGQRVLFLFRSRRHHADPALAR